MGLVSTALTLILALVIGAAIWLARNDHRLRATTHRMIESARRLLARLLTGRWDGGIKLPARFFDNAALAALAVGVVALCGLAALFAKVSDHVLDGDGLALVDRPIVAWLVAQREPVLTTVMRIATMVGSQPVVTAVITIVCTSGVADPERVTADDRRAGNGRIRHQRDRGQTRGWAPTPPAVLMR